LIRIKVVAPSGQDADDAERRIGRVPALVVRGDARPEARGLRTSLTSGSPFSPPRRYEQAATAASATAWSCSPLPPLTPTAPTIWPFIVSGAPPAKIITRPWFEMWMP
jgi:hypothetical protein